MRKFPVARFFPIFSSILYGLFPSSAWADQSLATARNCMLCHASEKKIIGPSFKAISAKYAGQSKEIDTVATKIRRGSSGEWGTLPMPANPQVSDEESKKLASWILLMK